MATNMGFYQDGWLTAGGDLNFCFLKKNRWRFIIPSVSASGVSSLPPSKLSRPQLQFKELQAEHLNETIYFPGKPDWKPITVTLYDTVKETENPVFSWLKRVYNPHKDACSYYRPCLENSGSNPYDDSPMLSFKCAEAILECYSGCGEVIETWVFEHCWPQSIEFVEGDHASSDVMTVDVTLRYDRAYIQGADGNAHPTTLTFGASVSGLNCDVVPAISMTTFAQTPEPDFIVLD